MPEKTMVTIDSDLAIPEGTEKAFENQHIRIGAVVEVGGVLIFKNCTLEPYCNEKSDDELLWYVWVQSTGKLEINGCEIIHPRKSFLYGDNMTITNTSFVFEPSPDTVISVNKNCTFAGCTFLGEGKASESDNESFRGQMSCRNAVVEDCTFQNINAVIAIEAISDCSFTDCGHISGLCVASTTFRDCASIQFIPSTFTGKGYVKNCDFVHVKSIFCQKTDVENCRFQNLLNDGSYKGMLYLDNCRASDCTFSDIELRNNSYLIFGEKNASVDNCEFTNCQTEREDSNLIYIEPPKKIAKGLFKGALKLAGSAALAAAGAAATIVREAANASGSDVLSDVAGTIQDASFEKIRDMWGGDDATRIDKMCQKIDRMNDDELLAYMEKLVLDMDEGDMEEFSKKVDAFTSEKEDAKARQQFRELLKETTKARGVPGSIDEEAKAKRAEERAETARRNGEQFAKRYEKEKAKFEDEHQ